MAVNYMKKSCECGKEHTATIDEVVIGITRL